MWKKQKAHKAKELRKLCGVLYALCTLNLAGTKATRANGNGSVSSVNDSLYLADIRLPGSVSFTVGVRYVVSESNTLTADTALSHFDTS